MAKLKITEQVAHWLQDYLQEQSLEVHKVEYIKEAGTWFLRVYIDDVSGEEEKYISIDQCQDVSKYLSEILDREDMIKENYFLEVSSPGLDRELIKEKDFVRFAGRMVDISLYQKIDGKKEYQGELVGIREDNIVILQENEERVLPASKVAKTKLAVMI